MNHNNFELRKTFLAVVFFFLFLFLFFGSFFFFFLIILFIQSPTMSGLLSKLPAPLNNGLVASGLVIGGIVAVLAYNHLSKPHPSHSHAHSHPHNFGRQNSKITSEISIFFESLESL